ncbi:hypothetical protein PL81_31690 [Streptomyces sp. RSD-27]|nr:hypothetical protein PL81_31690 [Streptomyces sp. RSD-27]
MKLIEGVADEDQKQQILQKVTDAVVSVTGEGLRPVIWATIEEAKSGQWTAGRNPVHTEDVLKAIAGEG